MQRREDIYGYSKRKINANDILMFDTYFSVTHVNVDDVRFYSAATLHLQYWVVIVSHEKIILK